MSETKKTARAVVLEVGRQKKRTIEDLKAGEGALADEAAQAAADVATTSAADVLPVVILFEKAPKRRRGLLDQVLRRR